MPSRGSVPVSIPMGKLTLISIIFLETTEQNETKFCILLMLSLLLYVLKKRWFHGVN